MLGRVLVLFVMVYVIGRLIYMFITCCEFSDLSLALFVCIYLPISNPNDVFVSFLLQLCVIWL